MNCRLPIADGPLQRNGRRLFGIGNLRHASAISASMNRGRADR
jgi:hypothetical protein